MKKKCTGCGVVFGLKHGSQTPELNTEHLVKKSTWSKNPMCGSDDKLPTVRFAPIKFFYTQARVLNR